MYDHSYQNSKSILDELATKKNDEEPRFCFDQQKNNKLRPTPKKNDELELMIFWNNAIIDLSELTREIKHRGGASIF